MLGQKTGQALSDYLFTHKKRYLNAWPLPDEKDRLRIIINCVGMHMLE